MMRPRSLLLCTTLAFVVACSSLQKESDNPEAYATFRDALSEHADWKQVVPGDIWMSKEHGSVWSEAYFDNTAFGGFKTGAPYPVGSLFIVDGFTTSTREERAGYWVMIKMEPGYDPEFGDWYYGRFDSRGVLINDGNSDNDAILDGCINCHSGARMTDFVFEP